MSWATGTVIDSSDNFVGYIWHNSTCDCFCTAIFKDKEEYIKARRTDAAYRVCNCKDPKVIDVLLGNNYGSRSSWEGTACVSCYTLLSGLSEEELYDY